MEILKDVLAELYCEFGNDKVVVALSQYLDKLVVKEQKKIS